MTADISTDKLLMLNAALDGELDAAGMIEVEREIAEEPALAAEYARLKALRQAINIHAPRDTAPQHLLDRVGAAAGLKIGKDEPRPHSIRDFFNLRSLAASIVGALVLAGAYAALPSSQNDDVTRAVVAGFMRAQVSGRPIDVVSSDRHTVKPWLAGRVPIATTVVDLSEQGYPLTGGRIDIVDSTAIPTLVYRYREHFISVAELSLSVAKYPEAPKRKTADGYSIVVWADRERSYAAVSDLPPAELDVFTTQFRRAVATEREDGGPSR